MAVRYGALGKSQLRQLQHTLEYFTELDAKRILSPHLRIQVAETLLAASVFSDRSWMFKALDFAKRIIAAEPEDYLRIWAIRREKTLSRSVPNAIHNRCDLLVGQAPMDERSNAQLGRLVLSNAQDLIESNDFPGALSELAKFDPLKEVPSALEEIVAHERDVAKAKVFRLQGEFAKARELFKKLLRDDQKLYKGTNRNLMAYLADTNCELGDPTEAERITVMMLDDSQDYNKDRRLRISLAEAHLCQGSFRAAEDICQKLKGSYESILEPDKVARMGYLRVLTILARIYHFESRWDDALSQWKNAMEAAKKCEWEEGFVEWVILYSISDIKIKLGELAESRQYFTRARILFEKAGCQHWFSTLGTEWIAWVGNSISSSGGCRIGNY